MTDARFGSAACHPDCVGIRVMIASPPRAIVDVTLQEWRASEFAAPDDQGVFQQSSTFQIHHQSGARLIRVTALVVEFGCQAVVLIPARMHQLDVSAATFNQASGEQAIVGKGTRFLDVWTVQLKRFLRLIGKVSQFGDAGLHLEAHFVLCNARCNFGITKFLQLQFVDGSNVIEPTPAYFPTDSIRIGDVENGVTAASEFDSLETRRQKTAAPVKIVEDLSTAGVLGDAGHHHKGGQFIGFATQAVR